ncbi:uncharacterized protein CBL_07516 [Carabus blaptoides fortunei]
MDSMNVQVSERPGNSKIREQLCLRNRAHPTPRIKSCYNIADFQNCKVVLYNENLLAGSHVNVLSNFEKEILSENKCNRKTLHSFQTENRINTPSPKKSDCVNLRITRSRNINISVPSSQDIGSGTSSCKELKSTKQGKTIQNNSAKKICTRELEQPTNNSNSFEIAKSSVPGKISDAICISPKATSKLTRDSRNVNVDVSLCDSEKEQIRAQPNVQNDSGDISEEVIVPANIRNPNSRLSENFVENSRVQVTSNNQFNAKYRVRKPNVQLSVVTTFLSYTEVDNNSPSGLTEDLHLDLSTVPPSDCSVNSNSLLDQSIKKECEFDVDNEYHCENAKISTSTNHPNQTISIDVFTEPSLIDRNQSLPVRINSAEYVKRFPRKRSKVTAENSASEDNTDSELSSLPDLGNSVSSSAKRVRKRNVLNSNPKLGTTNTDTHVKQASIDTSLGVTDHAVTVLKETEQNSASVTAVKAQKIPRKRGRPRKIRRVPPSSHRKQNASLPVSNSTTLPLEHNVGETAGSQQNIESSLLNHEDTVHTTLLQKYTALLECNLSPRVYLKRLETSRCLKSDPEPSTSQQQQDINVNLTSEIDIKSDPELFDESDWPYNNNMSPLYIKMRPEDNVTVDVRDLTPTESLIMLDIATCASHFGTTTNETVVISSDNIETSNHSAPQNITASSLQSPDSSTAVNGITKPQKLELNNVKLREVQKDKSKSKFHVHNFVKSVLSNESSMVEEISEQSNIIENTLGNVDSEKETCNFTNIEAKSKRKTRNGRYPTVNESSAIESKTKSSDEEQNILEDTTTHGAPNVNIPEDKITAKKRCRNSLKRNKELVNSEEETPDKPLLKSHEGTSKDSTEKKTKSKTKYGINLIQTTELPEEPRLAEDERISVDRREDSSSKGMNSLEDTPINGSKKKFKQKSNHSMTQNIHSKKETKSKLKAKMNLDKSEAAVSEESQTVVDTEEKSSLVNVEHPEDTHMSHSRTKSTSKLKHRINSIDSDEPIEPAVPVKLMKLIDHKKKKRKNKKQKKCFLEEVSKKKTQPKLKWKMKLGKHVLTKGSRKHVLEDTSDEEEILVFENIESSTTDVSSKLEENEKFHKKNSEPELYLKTKDVPNKPNEEDITHKDLDNKHLNYTGKKVKTKLNKKIKLDENKQTTVQTDDFVVKSISKNKEQSSELENMKSKLTVNPSTTQVTSKFEDNGKIHKKNYEQLVPSSKELSKMKDVQKKTNNNVTVKKVITKSKLNIKLEEIKQTTVPTDYCGIKSTSKLAAKTQSSELKILEPKLSTEPVTIETEKLKRIPKLSDKCRTNLVNKEEPKKVEGNAKKMNELENLALKNVKLSENLADTGVIATLNKNSYSELRRRAAQLPAIVNDMSKLQEISETFLFKTQNELVNPLANASEPLSEFSSSLDKNKQNESYLAAPAVTKLPNKTVPSTEPSTKPNRQISFDTNRATTTAKEPFVVEGITKIIPNTENTATKNAMLSREADFPKPFLVPSIPQRKRISFNTNTNAEEQTPPLKKNTDNDSCKDGMKREMRNSTSEECSARNKHSFNFLDTTVTPTQAKRTQKIKIKRPEMTDILTRNVKRKPLEDDSISIYAESICNDALFVKNDFDLDDDKEISPVDTSDIISDWIKDISGHAADNVTPQNTNSKQIKERFPPLKYPSINCNKFVEDEELSPTNNRVIDRIGMAESATKRPCLSDTRTNESSPGTRSHNLFDDVCKNVLEHGICKKYRCLYQQHTLPIDWEITLQNMSKESLLNLYSNTKKHMHLYKKIFPIVAKQLGFQRDFNSIISLVKDVLEINIDSDRTPYINAIIDALRSIGMTFNSVIEVIFNSTLVARNLKELLTDILINICVEQSDIENSWSTMKLLMNYRNYHVDAGIIKTILKKCMQKSKLQKELCLKVYSDLISHISDDKLGTIFESLLNDYIECLRTLGLSNEAQTLNERTAALSDQSSGSLLYMPTGSVHPKFVSEVSPMPIIPLFDIKFPVPPKLSPVPTFTQITTHKSPQNFNASYRRPIVNKVMPWNNKPDLLLKDVLADKPSNVPSTSATVAPYVEEIQTYSMGTVKQAIITENLSQLMSLILQFKEGDLTDEFLKTCLDAMQESAHNFAVLFRNLCQSVIVFQNEQDVKKDKSLEYIFKTIGTNLIIYSTHMNKWDQAYYIYQTLRDLYNECDIINVKMLMVDKPSYIKRLLIICRIFVKKDDCRHAWELFKVNGLHTSSSWTEVADQQDIQYRDIVFTELMTGLNKGKQWQTAFTIIEYILKHNITELDPIVDNTIQMAIKNECHAEYITSFMSVCPVWYNRIHCHTFRVIVVKLVRDHMYKMACTVYRQGSEMEIYPHLFGNEKCLEFSTHYVLEEILLMLKVFLQNIVNFLPIKHTVVIKAQQSTEITDETELPSLLYQNNMRQEMEVLPEGKNFRLVKEEELPEIIEVLEKYLPESLKFHQTIKTYLNDRVWDFHFYVSKTWPEEPVILHFPGMTKTPGDKLYESFSVFCPCEELEHLKLLEEEDMLVDWSEPIYLNFTHRLIMDQIEAFYADRGTMEKVSGDVYMCSNPPEDQDIIEVPAEDAEMLQLKPEHAQAIHDLYPANDMESQEVFEKLIAALPAYGVFSSGGELAAWMVQSYYGAMFSMQTRPEFRRKGYVIRPENDASKSLYTKLGFKKNFETVRAILRPHGCTNESHDGGTIQENGDCDKDN